MLQSCLKSPTLTRRYSKHIKRYQAVPSRYQVGTKWVLRTAPARAFCLSKPVLRTGPGATRHPVPALLWVPCLPSLPVPPPLLQALPVSSWIPLLLRQVLAPERLSSVHLMISLQPTPLLCARRSPLRCASKPAANAAAPIAQLLASARTACIHAQRAAATELAEARALQWMAAAQLGEYATLATAQRARMVRQHARAIAFFGYSFFCRVLLRCPLAQR